MGRREDLLRQVEALEERQRTLLAQAAQVGPLEDFLDNLPDGSVVRFERRFNARGTYYTYATIKIQPSVARRARWFQTNSYEHAGSGEITTDQLVKFMTGGLNSSDVRNFEWASNWEPVEAAAPAEWDFGMDLSILAGLLKVDPAKLRALVDETKDLSGGNG